MQYHQHIAVILVAAQFILAAAIFLSTPWLDGPVGATGFAAVGLLLAGSLLAVSAWWVMGHKQLRVLPYPAAEAQLLRHGPYGWIRHPMYAGLLLAALGCCLWDSNLLRGCLWLGLLVVLLWKTGIEEKLLIVKFADYAEYRKQTWRFIPGLW